MTVEAQPSTRRGSREIALTDMQATALSAQRARVRCSAIGELEADTAEIRGSLVERAHAAHSETLGSVVQRSSANVSEIDRSLVGVATADDMSLRMAASLAAKCDSLSVQGGVIGVAVAAGPVDVRGAAGVVVAPSVSLRGSRALLVLSPRVEGDYTTVLGGRQALLAGLAAGLVIFILQRLFRR